MSDTNGCPREELLAGLLAQALSPDEELELEAHLGGCMVCREALEADRAVSASLRALPRPEPSEAARARAYAAVLAAMEARGSASQPGGTRVAPAKPAAARPSSVAGLGVPAPGATRRPQLLALVACAASVIFVILLDRSSRPGPAKAAPELASASATARDKGAAQSRPPSEADDQEAQGDARGRPFRHADSNPAAGGAAATGGNPGFQAPATGHASPAPEPAGLEGKGSSPASSPRVTAPEDATRSQAYETEALGKRVDAEAAKASEAPERRDPGSAKASEERGQRDAGPTKVNEPPGQRDSALAKKDAGPPASGEVERRALVARAREVLLVARARDGFAPRAEKALRDRAPAPADETQRDDVAGGAAPARGVAAGKERAAAPAASPGTAAPEAAKGEGDAATNADSKDKNTSATVRRVWAGSADREAAPAAFDGVWTVGSRRILLRADGQVAIETLARAGGPDAPAARRSSTDRSDAPGADVAAVSSSVPTLASPGDPEVAALVRAIFEQELGARPQDVGWARRVLGLARFLGLDGDSADLLRTKGPGPLEAAPADPAPAPAVRPQAK